LALAERLDRPSPLLPVAGEGAVVDGQPRLVVDSRDERSGVDLDGSPVGRRRRIWYSVRPRFMWALSASAVCAVVGSNTHQFTRPPPSEATTSIAASISSGPIVAIS
jgi:hypothetical protein